MKFIYSPQWLNCTVLKLYKNDNEASIYNKKLKEFYQPDIPTANISLQ